MKFIIDTAVVSEIEELVSTVMIDGVARNPSLIPNVTLRFSAIQLLLTVKAGATFISSFIGRLDDIDIEGVELLHEIRTNFGNYDFGAEVLARRSAR